MTINLSLPSVFVIAVHQLLTPFCHTSWLLKCTLYLSKHAVLSMKKDLIRKNKVYVIGSQLKKGVYILYIYTIYTIHYILLVISSLIASYLYQEVNYRRVVLLININSDVKFSDRYLSAIKEAPKEFFQNIFSTHSKLV